MVLALLLVAVTVLAGCTVSLQGKPLVGVDPNGTLTYEHPEMLTTNQVIVPHL